MNEVIQQQLTEVQVNDLFKDCPLTFSSYYKYTFYYKGCLPNGMTIAASRGGQAEDIYKYEVRADVPVPFGGCENWNCIEVSDGSKSIFTHRGGDGYY